MGACPIFADSAERYAGFATVVSPLFTLWVLTCLSGIPQAEGVHAKRWYDGGEAQAAYEAYFESTPPLWVFPPALYKPLPLPLKRVLCLELPSYAYPGPGQSDLAESLGPAVAAAAVDVPRTPPTESP